MMFSTVSVRFGAPLANQASVPLLDIADVVNGLCIINGAQGFKRLDRILLICF